jgi:hypothetical protein
MHGGTLDADIQQRSVDAIGQAFLNHTCDVRNLGQICNLAFGSHEIPL